MSSNKTGNQAMGASYFLTPPMFAFMALWIAETVSLIGSGMTCFANSVYIYTDMGGSITNLVLLAVIAQIPGIVLSPFAGVLVDHWDRRWVMIIGNTVSALATLILRLLVVSVSFKLWHMYVLVMIISSANHFQWPAYFSTVPLMVPKDRLGSANGLVQMGRSIGALAAPIMAGIAVSRFKLQGVILFDMMTYIFALGVIVLVKIPKIPARQSVKGKFSFWRETLYGWQYIIARPELLSLLIFSGISFFLYTSGNCLIIPLGLSFISPKALGSFLSLGGLAMIVGGVVMSIWGGPKRKVYGIIGFIILQALAFMLEGFRFYMPAIVMGFLLFSFAESFISACSGAIWHRKVPLEMQGRVAAVIGMVTTGALELGYASSGLLADNLFIPRLLDNGSSWASTLGPIFGTGVASALCFMFVVYGLLSLGLALLGFAYKPFRFLEDRLGESPADRSILNAVQVKMCPAIPSSAAVPVKEYGNVIR